MEEAVNEKINTGKKWGFLTYENVQGGQSLSVWQFQYFHFIFLLIYIIIGLLVKASVFKINNTKISIAHMTVADILADGFEIYVRQYEIPSRNY